METLVSNRYQLHDTLGKGGMGEVYHATDRLTGAAVALKRVMTRPSDLTFASMTDSDDMQVALAHEFQTLAGLRHPHIISVLDYGFDDDGLPYYTMPLLSETQDIRTVAANLPLTDKVRLLIQVLQALSYLHHRDILHRDLKPANILVDAWQQVRVVDFGLASASQQSSGMAGTLNYLAPEIFQGEPATAATDLYAVGILSYEMLTGDHPYNTSDTASLIYHTLNTPPTLDELPPDLLFPIGRMLEKNPEARYQYAGDVIRDLCHALDLTIPPESRTIQEGFIKTARFVGRKDELGQLTTAMQQTLDGHGSAWLIGGESGVGKSRLLAELRTRALVNGVPVMSGQAVAEGGAPFLLWRDILRHLSLHLELSELEASVLKPLVPDIGRILKQDIPDAPEIEPEATRTRLFTVVHDIIARYEGPLILLMEDLQWADESLQLLKHIAPLAEIRPLLIVANYRDDERPDMPFALPGMQLMILQRLNEAEVAALSQAILGRETGSRQDVVELLQEETEGNVFFIVEVIRMLAEKSGRMSRIGVATLPPSVFASGIQDVVQHRLSRVPHSARELLRIMAIAGRYLDRGVLKAVVELQPDLPGDNRTIDAWLNICADASVIEVSADRWRFTHDKMREGLLVDITDDDRYRYHRMIAEALEASHPNDPDYYIALAFHWQAAQNMVKELHYIMAAGEQSLEHAAYQQAIGYLRRADALIDREFPDTPPLTRARIARQLGQAYDGLGKVEAARQQFETVLTLLGDRVPQRTGTIIRLLVMQIIVQLWHLLRRPHPKATDYSRVERVRACDALTMIHYWKSDKLATVYYIFKSLNIAERLPPLPELVRAYASMYSLMMILPIPLDGYYARRMQKTGEAVDHPLALAAALRNQLVSTIGSGQWQVTQEYSQQSLEVALEFGDFRIAGDCHEFRRYMAWYQGDLNQAAQEANALYELSERSQNHQHQAWALCSLAFDNLRMGDLAEAIKVFEHGIKQHTGDGARGHQILSHGGLALAHLRSGDASHAREAASTAAQLIMDTPPLSSSLVDGYAGVMEVYLWHLAKSPADKALQNTVKDMFVEFKTYAGNFPIAEPALYRARGRAALQDAQSEKARQAFEKSLKLAREYGMAIAEADALIELGRLNKDRAAFEQAAAIYERVDAIHALQTLRRVQAVVLEG